MTEKLPVVIAIVNNKGGVGKTTTSVNLGAALAARRRRVLLVDLDSQASASVWCGVPRSRLKPSSASCLLHSYPVNKAIRTTATANLDLITGSIELANADVTLCDLVGRETALKTLLRAIRGRYDLIILDCPPGLSLLCVNALIAADALIVPVSPQFLVSEGLVGLLGTVDLARSRLGARGRLLGILLTMVDSNCPAARELGERLRAKYPDRVFRTEIAHSRPLAEAPAACKTILAFAPGSAAAHAFRRLATEVLERVRSERRIPS